MRQVTIFLMAIAIAVALTPAAMGDIVGGRRKSRFLQQATADPNNSKRCSVNPSVCRGAGKPGRSCCGDQCVDVDSDPANCGKCSRLCNVTQACCRGKCVHLAFDKKNCGSCFNKCKKTCSYGLCDYA